MKISKITVGIIGFYILGYLIVGPYLAAYQMKYAAENYDGETLSEFIDFSSLRQSLKGQANAVVGKQMMKKAEKNKTLVALGAAFGGVMVDKMVDAYITPAGVAELMRGKRPDVESGASNSVGGEVLEPFQDAAMHFESFFKFSIVTKDRKTDEEIKFILRRRGLNWKLTEIIVPLQVDRY